MEVQLFATCLVESWRPTILSATEQILAHLGVRTRRLKSVACCGQVAFNGGEWKTARTIAIAWLRSVDPDLPVVVPSGSCCAMLTHNLAFLLEDSPLRSRWETIRHQTYELSQFLVEVLGVEEMGIRKPHERVTYHPSCHLKRVLGVEEPPERLIRAVAGEAYVPLPEAEVCCGFGGLFAVHFPELSKAMLERKIEAIVQTGATTVLGCDWSCLMQIAGGLHRAGHSIRCLHLAEWLVSRESAP